jgi:ABC-type multidrug transport system ATPase subunit
MALMARSTQVREELRKLNFLIPCAGELCALMGPSGSGKSTLLNVLARRGVSSGATIEGSVMVNGSNPSLTSFRKLTSYVEQGKFPWPPYCSHFT